MLSTSKLLILLSLLSWHCSCEAYRRHEYVGGGAEIDPDYWAFPPVYVEAAKFVYPNEEWPLERLKRCIAKRKCDYDCERVTKQLCLSKKACEADGGHYINEEQMPLMRYTKGHGTCKGTRVCCGGMDETSRYWQPRWGVHHIDAKTYKRIKEELGAGERQKYRRSGGYEGKKSFGQGYLLADYKLTFTCEFNTRNLTS